MLGSLAADALQGGATVKRRDATHAPDVRMLTPEQWRAHQHHASRLGNCARTGSGTSVLDSTETTGLRSASGMQRGALTCEPEAQRPVSRSSKQSRGCTHETWNSA